MTTWINIFAMVLLSVVPYLRPCSCSGFTLFCQCAVTAEAEPDAVASDAAEHDVQQSEPEQPACCCCEAAAEKSAEKSADKAATESHKPNTPPHHDDDKPCQRSMLPELTGAVLAQPVVDAAVSQPAFAALPVTLVRLQAAPTESSPCSPRAPPAETGTLAFRTNFLLI